MSPSLAKAMRTAGFVVLKSALTEDECLELEEDLVPVISEARGAGARPHPHGIRNLLTKCPSLRRRISTAQFMRVAEEALGAVLEPAKGIYLNVAKLNV